MRFGSDRGSSRTPVRTEQAEPMRTAVDASNCCQLCRAGCTFRSDERASSLRGVAGGRVFERKLQQHPLPTRRPPIGTLRRKNAAHSDRSRCSGAESRLTSHRQRQPCSPPGRRADDKRAPTMAAAPPSSESRRARTSTNQLKGTPRAPRGDIEGRSAPRARPSWRRRSPPRPWLG